MENFSIKSLKIIDIIYNGYKFEYFRSDFYRKVIIMSIKREVKRAFDKWEKGKTKIGFDSKKIQRRKFKS